MQVGLVTHYGHWERCECSGQDGLLTGELVLVPGWVELLIKHIDQAGRVALCNQYLRMTRKGIRS